MHAWQGTYSFDRVRVDSTSGQNRKTDPEECRGYPIIPLVEIFPSTYLKATTSIILDSMRLLHRSRIWEVIEYIGLIAALHSERVAPPPPAVEEGEVESAGSPPTSKAREREPHQLQRWYSLVLAYMMHQY